MCGHGVHDGAGKARDEDAAGAHGGKVDGSADGRGVHDFLDAVWEPWSAVYLDIRGQRRNSLKSCVKEVNAKAGKVQQAD